MLFVEIEIYIFGSVFVCKKYMLILDHYKGRGTS